MPGSQKARPPRMRYCSRCVYPQIAVFVTLEDTGACSGCRVSDQKKEIDWKERGEMLREILEEYRSKDGSRLVDAKRITLADGRVVSGASAGDGRPQ